MVLHILRALFILLMAAIGWFYVQSAVKPFADLSWLAVAIAVSFGTLLVCIDIISPRRKLVLFSGTFLGLIIGVSIAYALSFVVQLLADQYLIRLTTETAASRETLVRFVDMMIGVASCYLAISFILQTRDDFRFIIPYVEFSKQTKGARSILLDTSVLIDGRITDIAKTGIFESQIVVPQFVLGELQRIADSADTLKRARGRRGLDVLAGLRSLKRADVVIYDSSGRPGAGRDHVPLHADEAEEDLQLMELAKGMNARVLTNDYNLNKVAELRGVDVININELANAVKPMVLPGERMTVHIQKPGAESGQGVGYLEDGTMVVVEQARGVIGADVEFIVTNMRQTVAGRMIFGRLSENHGNASNAGGNTHPADAPVARRGHRPSEARS